MATSKPRTLVWIDAERAVAVRWDGSATVSHIDSDVPPHRRMGGHVAHDVMLRTAGSPPPDRHRLEHLRRYLRQVADRLNATDDVEVIGPGTVHEQLAALLSNEDRRHGRTRDVVGARAGRLSEAQLVARLRTAAGAAPRRVRKSVVGAG